MCEHFWLLFRGVILPTARSDSVNPFIFSFTLHERPHFCQLAGLFFIEPNVRVSLSSESMSAFISQLCVVTLCVAWVATRSSGAMAARIGLFMARSE